MLHFRGRQIEKTHSFLFLLLRFFYRHFFFTSVVGVYILSYLILPFESSIRLYTKHWSLLFQYLRRLLIITRVFFVTRLFFLVIVIPYFATKYQLNFTHLKDLLSALLTSNISMAYSFILCATNTRRDMEL